MLKGLYVTLLVLDSAQYSAETLRNWATSSERPAAGLWVTGSVTSASSLPANFLYALVHRTLRGFLFILKFLWHFERQKLNTCMQMQLSAPPSADVLRRAQVRDARGTYRAVIADEGYSMAGVDSAGAEPALF